ncbi:photosystem reaction center subunit H [Altererythrobacter sp. B11]|uniref:PRC-barrel domain-containing protein n=1 Tax=Altererythrobacter sp. B11 TaxID=2060312 RepID=UPI000DC7249B|nr:PRC-barrel domain-containing protein [Altererythrobacter sp. B11]BBC71365.1 photosystem reaction center subunit H [Altererythrobacter sp. B11]
MDMTQGNRSSYSDAELDRRREYDRSRPVERDETHNLISSDKVDGTPVYSLDGEKVGHIDHLMIGKRSGRVEYAVMSFGGFLGIGESYHPLPWETLDYDTDRGGYVVNIDKAKLRDAPHYEANAAPPFDRAYGQNVYTYYGVLY